MKIAIIGGVAAGTSAAAKASRENKEAEIVIFEKGKDISYAGCGLPYYISGVIKERNRVVINTPEEFSLKYNVKLMIGHRVQEIIPAKKMLKYKTSNSDKTAIYQYDKLIIATGARPVVPSFPGIELENILALRSLSDADKIKKIVEKDELKKVTIVGAGLIGLEMVESFKRLGLEVTVIEKMTQVLPGFSKGMARIVAEHLVNMDVTLILNDGVKEFKGDKKVRKINTIRGGELSTDLVLLSVGIKPNTELVENIDIKLGNSGAINANEKMETSIPDIYAAGDCAESRDLITGKSVWVPLGSTANKQGRVAGGNAVGGNYKHKGILKTGITKIFEITAARTGLSTVEAEKEGYNIMTKTIKAKNHAAYYPNSESVYIKGIFDIDSGRILGAEVIGKSGVDKRIDILSTAIYSELRVEDLFQLDLAYAPSFSTPKDPVAILGMVAENIG